MWKWGDILFMDEEQKSGKNSWKDTVEELKKMIPEIYPQWTDYNVHDPGITLLELTAWLQQIQIYQISRIGKEHRRDYLKLLGVDPVRRHPGRTMVTVRSEEPVRLLAGTRFYAGHIPFETRVEQMATEGAFLRFVTHAGYAAETLEGEWIREGMGISLFPFGREPEPGNRMEIQLNRALEAGVCHRLYMEFLEHAEIKRIPVDEAAFDGHGFYPLAEIRIEYLSAEGWRTVQIREQGQGRDGTYGFIQKGSILFSLDVPMMKDCFCLRFVLLRGDYVQAPCITRISLSMVEVWQQETEAEDKLPAFMGDGFPGQRFDMEDQSIWEEAFMLEAEAPALEPERGDLIWKMEPWTQVTDFHCSGPDSRHYILEDGTILFGDGVNGMMPEGRIRASRLVRTLGEEGNIKSGTIDRIELTGAREQDIVICHEMDVSGGADNETAEEALKRFGRQQEEQWERPAQRAVTFRDYENLVMRTPGLLIESCRAYSIRPELNEIIVAVKTGPPAGKSNLNNGYRKNIYRFLEEKRMIGTKIRLTPPDYYDVTIVCMVRAKVQYRLADQMVEEAVRNWIASHGFGQGISYGELLGMIDALPCVQQISSLWLDAGSRGKRNSRGDVLLPPNGLLYLKKVTCNLITSTREGI